MKNWCFLLFSLPFVNSQILPQYLGQDWRCPEHWIEFQGSCYRFVKSPIRNREQARANCRIYTADLISVNTLEEHGFIVETLQAIDPQKRKWYTGGVRQAGYWVNEFDNSPLSNFDLAFLPQSPPMYSYKPRDFMVYSYSIPLGRWGFEEVTGEDKLLYICEAPVTSLLHLLMEDRSFSYGVDVPDIRYIPRGPKFIKEPQDVVFDLSKRRINNDVSMSCLATGYPAPTYEWFREKYVNDRLIEERIDPLEDRRVTISGGILIINNPDNVNDRGFYHCKATNKFGVVVSESALISFGYIGEFNLKRSPETGDMNWGKAIFCDPPQHSPGVSYYWNRDFFPNFVDEDQRVFSSHDGALYFSALAKLDDARYSCSVKSKVSDMGRNGPFFPLTVHEHPNYQQLKFPNNFPKVFPEAPVAGQEVRLECVAFGYPVPSYNWTRVNSTIPRGALFSSYNRVLTIPRARVEDQGEYVCRASNDRAAITQGVLLTIQAEPNFTIPLTDKHMNIRGSLTWTCEAFGIPDVSYTWFKNGVELIPASMYPGDRERYTVQDNILTIQNLDPVRDQAMFQCRATNQMKTRYSSAQLRVLALKPSFKKTPLEAETYAAEGGNVTIFCNPEAAPSPKFFWKKNGALLGSGGRRLIMNNGNLLINHVSRDDAGLYSCAAENEYGRDESFGRLIVLGGPHFIEVMKPLFVAKMGENVALYCNAVSDDMLDVAYIWTHNGIRIREDHAGHARMRVETGVLSIQNATYAESGDYECIVKSAVGRIATRTQVIIEGPPGPPGGVQVAEVKKTSAKIQWTDGASNGRPILFYAIYARTAGNSTWMRLVRDVRALEIDRYYGRKQFELEGLLSPYCAYEFTISAANSIGYGPMSAPSPQYHTPPDRPYRPPGRVSGGGGKIGDLTITWEPLPYVDQNGPGLHYKVFWRRTRHETEFQSEVLKEYGNTNQAVVQVPKDYFYTQYDVKVQAINDVGFGPQSDIYTIYSAEDMPQVAPQEVSARSFNSTALNVTWLPISESRETVRGKLIGYRIKYWVKDREETQATYYLSRSTRPWAIVVGLMPDTYYFVKVLAYNAAGEGPESERYIERTYLKAAQKPPAAVTLEGINPTTIRVTWRSVTPSYDEEPILGYKVRVWEQDRDMNTAKDTFLKVGHKLEVYITELNPVKTYHLRVLAFSNGGDGRMSSPVHTFRLADPALYRLNGATRGAVISWLTVMLTILVYFSRRML